MLLKANLHLHTREDKIEGFAIQYSIYEAIDRAAAYGFSVLALTGHQKCLFREEYGVYAANRKIKLIPGVELFLRSSWRRNDVLVLNCQPDIEKIKNLPDLRAYKNEHPEIFVIAPHPFYGLFSSLGGHNLQANLDIFDAIEHSWYYSAWFNPNRPASTAARAAGKPLIATSDSHTLRFLNDDYITIDAASWDCPDLFAALRANRFSLSTREKNGFELLWLARHEWALIKGYVRQTAARWPNFFQHE